MGFGHRVYQVRDPRADAIKAALKRVMENKSKDESRLMLAEAVEAAAISALASHKPDHSLATNVEFYTALLLEQLDFPRGAFTCVFAMGRAMGWAAHCREQIKENKLIRPKSNYIGPKLELVS